MREADMHSLTYRNGVWAYGDWRIAKNIKPVPVRAYDWDYWHIDYDGPEDQRAGCCASLGQCLEEIILEQP